MEVFMEVSWAVMAVSSGFMAVSLAFMVPHGSSRVFMEQARQADRHTPRALKSDQTKNQSEFSVLQ